MNLNEWKAKNSSAASYAHFDRRVGINDVWSYISDVDKVAKHSFYPFITYNQVFYRYSKKNNVKEIKAKVRPICYASHLDRCIFKYYAYLLDAKYNKYADNAGISKSAVAYRTNLHKNNIHFAKSAFDFIKQGDCYVMVGDFTSFFDNLDHKYLKKMLCKILEIESLSKDWYAIYKNITKYSKWSLLDILKINNLVSENDVKIKIKSVKLAQKQKITNNKVKNTRYFDYYFTKQIKKLNKQKMALTKEQFKENKRKCVKKNVCGSEEGIGIPQGSAISSVLSNVYMFDFDKKIYDFVSSLNGFYLRYSDDFIVVIPKNIEFKKFSDFLHEVVDETSGVYLQPDKTDLYTYDGNVLKNPKGEIDYLDYLGFVFDGNEVTLRAKTVSKYYYRMYKKIKGIERCKGVTKKGNRISYKNLYKTYTQKGRYGYKNRNEKTHRDGNFFTHVYKSNEIFNGNKKSAERDPIDRATKRHMLKIRRIRNRIK